MTPTARSLPVSLLGLIFGFLEAAECFASFYLVSRLWRTARPIWSTVNLSSRSPQSRALTWTPRCQVTCIVVASLQKFQIEALNKLPGIEELVVEDANEKLHALSRTLCDCSNSCNEANLSPSLKLKRVVVRNPTYVFYTIIDFSTFHNWLLLSENLVSLVVALPFDKDKLFRTLLNAQNLRDFEIEHSNRQHAELNQGSWLGYLSDLDLSVLPALLRKLWRFNAPGLSLYPETFASLHVPELQYLAFDCDWSDSRMFEEFRDRHPQLTIGLSCACSK